MAIVGLIPFVYATIKRKRRRSMMARDAESYAYAGLGDNAARGRARGAYQPQSCHFAVRPSLDDELGFPYDDYGYSAALYPPPKAEALSREPLRAGESARFDGGGYQSQTCRFVVRPSLVDELVASREDGASRRPPAQLEGLSRQMLLPASRHDGQATGAARGQGHARSNGSAYESQSCRFVVHHSAAYEHDEEYGTASTPPEDLSGKLLSPTGRSERGLSRSLRFSSKRVFAWVSGA